MRQSSDCTRRLAECPCPPSTAIPRPRRNSSRSWLACLVQTQEYRRQLAMAMTKRTSWKRPPCAGALVVDREVSPVAAVLCRRPSDLRNGAERSTPSARASEAWRLRLPVTPFPTSTLSPVRFGLACRAVLGRLTREPQVVPLRPPSLDLSFSTGRSAFQLVVGRVRSLLLPRRLRSLRQLRSRRHRRRKRLHWRMRKWLTRRASMRRRLISSPRLQRCSLRILRSRRPRPRVVTSWSLPISRAVAG